MSSDRRTTTGIGWALRRGMLGHTRTVTKEYEVLHSALADAGLDTSALDSLYNSGNYDDRTRQLFALCSKWWDSSNGDETIALGAIQAMLQNQINVEQNQSDAPQVLANYVSYKWGVGSAQWQGLMKIRSQPDGPSQLEWVYYQWASPSSGSFKDGVLSGYLTDPSSIPINYNHLDPPPSSPAYLPPFGPPTPPSNAKPQDTLSGTGNTDYMLVGGLIVVVGAYALYTKYAF